jgi:hypothetical protein
MTGLVNSLMGERCRDSMPSPQVTKTLPENFYIPPIILNKKTKSVANTSTRQDTLVCVDGKQRLSSVRAFVKGMIPCHDRHGQKWYEQDHTRSTRQEMANSSRWFCETSDSNRRRKILPEATQRLFLNKDFVAFEFTELTPEQEEDLFARVQMGLQLTLAERMRASTGPWQELAKLFVDDFPGIYGLMKDRARAKDFQLTLSCFSQIVEVQHPTASNGIPILKTSHAALPRLLSNKGAVDDGIKSHLASVWNTFKELLEEDADTFTNSNKYLRGVQTFAPIEMVACTVLISVYSDTRNNRLLLGDIRALREALREHFVDLRLNAPIWKFIWDYVENMEAIRGAVDGSTVNRRPTEQRRGPPSTNATVIIPRKSPPPSGTQPGPTATKGKTTTKAKPVDKLPTVQTVKREENASSPASNPRSAKRKRTGAQSVPDTSAVIHPLNGATTSSQIPMAGIARGPLQKAHQLPGNLVYPPMPTHTGPQFTTQRRPEERTPMPGISGARSLSQLTPLPTHSQTQQIGVSAVDFQTRTAPTGLPTASQATLMDVQARATESSQPPDVANRHWSDARSIGWRTGSGASMPSFVGPPWEGRVEPRSPPLQVTHASASKALSLITASPSARIGPMQKKRRSVPAPATGQHDDVIDLTSDTELEQERRDLLSAFKGRSITEKQPQSSTGLGSQVPIPGVGRYQAQVENAE